MRRRTKRQSGRSISDSGRAEVRSTSSYPNDTLPRRDGSSISNELFVAVDGEIVRGAYSRSRRFEPSPRTVQLPG